MLRVRLVASASVVVRMTMGPKSRGSTEEVPVETAVGSASSRLPAFDANPSVLLAREDEEAEVPRVLVTGRGSRSTSIGPDNRRADRRTDMSEEGGENLLGEGVWKVARRSAWCSVYHFSYSRNLRRWSWCRRTGRQSGRWSTFR